VSQHYNHINYEKAISTSHWSLLGDVTWLHFFQSVVRYVEPKGHSVVRKWRRSPLQCWTVIISMTSPTSHRDLSLHVICSSFDCGERHLITFRTINGAHS